MLSLPNHWTFRENHLLTQAPSGRDHLRRIIKELEEAGYLKRTMERDGKGRAAGYRWDVFSSPQETGGNGPGRKAGKPNQPNDGGQSTTGISPWAGNQTMEVFPSTDEAETPWTENQSMEETQSGTGICPSTGNTSMDEPLPLDPWTGNPSTDNPPPYKETHIQESPNNKKISPPYPFTSFTDRHPPSGVVPAHTQPEPAESEIFSALNSQLPDTPTPPLELPAASEAPTSPQKALEAAAASSASTTPRRGPSKARKPAAALPGFAEPVRPDLERWYRARHQRHKIPADEQGLSVRGVNALTYAHEHGVLVEFAALAADAGWVSLGFNGYRDYIDKLAAENLNATSGHSESRTVSSGRGAWATSRQSEAVERAIALTSIHDTSCFPVATCSNTPTFTAF